MERLFSPKEAKLKLKQVPKQIKKKDYNYGIEHKVIKTDKIKEGKKNDPLYPSTDAQIDYIYGPDASEKAMTAVANKNKSKKKYNSPK